MATKQKSRRKNLLMSIAWKALLAFGLASPAMAITTQDDIDPEALVDVDNQYANVAGIAIRIGNSGFVCSGTLINPRTVLTATHCVRNAGGSEIYQQTGNWRIGVTFDPEFGLGGAITWLNANVGMINASDVIMPAGANAAGFPDLDFTIIALSEAVGGIEYAPVLLSPLTQATLATIVGYGTFGTGSNPEMGLDFRRRAARNVIDYLGNFDDYIEDTGFGPGQGGSQQMLYWADFDFVGRTDFFTDPVGLDYDTFPGDGVSSPNPQETEGDTGGGDSGGPLFAHINGDLYLAGVLSGGLTIWVDENGNPLFGFYGAPTYWNPIYEYAGFLIANNPYKYVEARRGDGDWTDPRHWEQTLDPGYIILDRHGNPVNAIPRRDPDDEDIKFGQARDIFDIFDGGDGLPDAAALTTDRAEISGSLATDPQSDGGHGPPPGHADPRPPSLEGPGSRNFVPNNTDGTPGTEFANPARYFDVTLSNWGDTTLDDASIEIDRLTISNEDAFLIIEDDGALTVNLETEIIFGRLNVNGVLNTRTLVNTLGVLEGDGVITTTNGVFNLAGLTSPGGYFTGTLTINGNYAQSVLGTHYMQIGRHGVDLLEVNGTAEIAGNLLVSANRRIRFGDRYTVIHADNVIGNFDHTFGFGTLLYGEAVADADSIDLVINAHRLSNIYGHGHRYGSLALALDIARNSRNYFALQGVYDLVDNIQLTSMDFFLPSLTPINSFSEMPLAISYAQGFTRDLFARTAELRAGQRGVSQRSLLNGYRVFNGETADDDNPWDAAYQPQDGRAVERGERFGFFFAGQGNLNDVGAEAYQDDRYNPASLSQSSMANMTIGADYRVSENFAIGVASTASRYLARSGEQTPLDHTGYGAMVYASAWDGGWFADGYAGVAQQDYAMSRSALTGIPLQTVDAEQGATQTLAGARAGYTFNPLNGLNISPVVSLNYSRVNFDAYSENGGGDFDLLVDARQLNSLTVESALEFNYQPIGRNGRASPFAAYGRVGFVNEVGDGSDTIYARFAAAPEVGFDLTQELDREWYSAGGGVSYRFGPNTTFNLEAQSDIDRSDLSTLSVTMGFNHSF